MKVDKEKIIELFQSSPKSFPEYPLEMKELFIELFPDDIDELTKVIIYKRFYEDSGIEDIAEALGVPYEFVRRRLALYFANMRSKYTGQKHINNEFIEKRKLARLKRVRKEMITIFKNRKDSKVIRTLVTMKVLQDIINKMKK